jgi:hypothetical protein
MTWDVLKLTLVDGLHKNYLLAAPLYGTTLTLSVWEALDLPGDRHFPYTAGNGVCSGGLPTR